MTEQPNYWINKDNCYWNSSWNTTHLGIKTNKARYGCLYYKGKCVGGNDKDFNLFEKIPTRKFHYGCGHTWTETKDNEVIDWMINYALKKSSKEQILWKKDELLEMGFEYKYYENEVAIKKKVKLFNCNCKEVEKENKENPLSNDDCWDGTPRKCQVLWAKNYWRSSDL